MTTAIQTGREREAVNTWEKFLEHVKSRVSINTYTTWFQPTRLNRAEGETLYVQIPTAVFRQVLTRTYGEIVNRSPFVSPMLFGMAKPGSRLQYCA